METAKIRIGKDFTILWRIYKKENGEKTPYMLAAGKENYILRLWTPYGKQEITRFEIDENTIQFDFLGKDQKHLGNYSLELVERKNAIGMVTVDTAGFTLVAFSRYETDGNNSDVVIQDVKLETELGLTPIVSLTIDTEFSDTSHNAVSNYVLTEKFKQVDEKIKVLQSAVDALDMKSIEQAIANKVDKEEGKTLSSNDFTDAEKSKLEGVEDGAQKNDYGLSGVITYPLESINADGTWEMVCSYAPGVPAFLVLTIKPDYVFQLTAGQEEQIYDVRLKRDNKGIYIQTTRTDVKRYALLVASSVKKLSENYISDAIARNADVDEKLKTKQDVVEDLATIRSGAAKGATAVQNVVSSNSNYAGVTREGYEWIIMPKTKKVSEAGDPVDHLSGIADAYDVKQELAKKVDKVSGKQLSTEDFTTALKQKLQSLNNYDDSALTSAINSLQNQINTLVSGNASSAIDTFNEIIAFLNGVKDTQDLAGIIASIEQQIASVNNSLSAELAKKPNKTELATINGQSLTNGGNIVIEGKNYDAEIAARNVGAVDVEGDPEAPDAPSGGSYDDTEIKERLEEQDQLIEDLQNMKIDREADDYYPKLAVGLADNLAGVDVVDSEINFRRSGGGAITDGVARIEAIKGNSVVWNQRWSLGVRQGVIDNTDGASPKYVSLGFIPWYTTAINGHKILTIANDKEGVIDRVYWNDQVQNDVRGGAIYEAKTLQTTGSSLTARCPANTIDNYDVTIQLYDLTQMFGSGNEPITIEEFYQRIPMGVDLNAYNEGEVIDMNVQGIKSVGRNLLNLNRKEFLPTQISRPTQPKEFSEDVWINGISSNGYYMPTQRLTAVVGDGSIKGTAQSHSYGVGLPIKVVKGATYYKNNGTARCIFSEYDKEGVYLRGSYSPVYTPSNECEWLVVVFLSASDSDLTLSYTNIIVNISDTDFNGQYEPHIEASEDLSLVAKYFPNGMRSTNKSCYDEFRYIKQTNKREAVQRIGEVKMKDLSWAISSNVFFANFDKMRWVLSSGLGLQGAYTGLLTSKYEFIGYQSFDSMTNYSKAMGVASSASRILIYDTSYTDVASFVASFTDDDIIYYELAEPIVTEIEEKDFNLDYNVWNNGTEQAIAEGKSSALSADITYGFNAIGKIKELESLVAALRAKVGI